MVLLAVGCMTSGAISASGPEHVRTLQQIRPRQRVFRGLLDAIAEQQHVEIHGARRPLGRDTRGRPHSVSMARSRAITASSGCAVVKPTTRLMKSGPSKPTATLR